MEAENLTLSQILEWYVCAGVDETCGDVPFALPPKVEDKPIPIVGLGVRQATSGLAQAVSSACNEINVPMGVIPWEHILCKLF